jgi:hypothetical protein
MTKHNLKDHLAWLLQNALPTSPLEYASIPIAESVDSNSPTAADQGPTPALTESLRLAAQVNYGLQDPAAPAMARLQLAPQPVGRSRLLTQTDATPAQAHPSLPTPAPSRSPFEQTIVRQSHEPSVKRTPAAVNVQRPLHTPLTGYEDSVFDDASEVFDIDELELTGDHDTSFEEFGEPKRLWREDSATRKEPLPTKRGRKRKSDEYTSDIGRPQSAERDHAYARPLNIVREASANANRRKSPRDCGRDPLGSLGSNSQSIRYDEELSITETTIRTETRKSRSSAQAPLLQVSQSPDKSKRHGDQEKRLQPPRKAQDDISASRRPGKIVVSDSEDEEEETQEKVKKQNKIRPLRNMDYEWDNDDEEALVSPSPVKPKHMPSQSPVKQEPLPSPSAKKIKSDTGSILQ